MRKGKKAQLGIPDRTFKIVILGFIIPMVVFAFVYFGFSFKTPYVPKELDIILSSERFMSTCFSYQDPHTLRTYPGIIDISKFTQQQLDRCYYIEEPDARLRAYRLKIEYGSESAALSTSNWDESTTFDVDTKNILVRKDGKNNIGLMRIGIQNYK